jgi:O-antigen/teichoic acid export membrane protein
MLLLAPPILHALGIERYGIWILANATLGTGAILASGFGDANTRSAAVALGEGRHDSLITIVRSSLSIHIALGTAAALIVWLLAPTLAYSSVKHNTALIGDSIWSLRIAAALIFIRAVETVCVSTQRAFCRYGSAIQISITARILCLLAACVVSSGAHTVSAVMASSFAISSLALMIQFRQLSGILNTANLWPSFQGGITRALLRFGVFTWIQSASGLLFGQVDRIIAATVFGAAAAASYAFCAQIAMPIYGLAAAGLHFLFPLLTTQHSPRNEANAWRSIITALSVNIAFVGIALATLMLFGNAILRIWGGPVIAAAAEHLLPIVAWGAALPALGVTGCYAMLAFGRAHIVSVLSFAAGITMSAAITILMPRYGIAGIAYGRIIFGPVVLAIYFPLFNILTRTSRQLMPSATATIYEEA